MDTEYTDMYPPEMSARDYFGLFMLQIEFPLLHLPRLVSSATTVPLPVQITEIILESFLPFTSHNNYNHMLN